MTDTEWEAYTQAPPTRPRPDVLSADDYRVGDAVVAHWPGDDGTQLGAGYVVSVSHGGKCVYVSLNGNGRLQPCRTFTGSFTDGTGRRMVTHTTRPRPAGG